MEVTVSLPLSSQHTQHSSTQLEQVSEVRSGMYTWSSQQEQWTTVVTSLRQKYELFELRGLWIFLCWGDYLMLWYSVLSGSDHSHTTPQETTVTISWTVSPLSACQTHWTQSRDPGHHSTHSTTQFSLLTLQSPVTSQLEIQSRRGEAGGGHVRDVSHGGHCRAG